MFTVLVFCGGVFVLTVETGLSLGARQAEHIAHRLETELSAVTGKPVYARLESARLSGGSDARGFLAFSVRNLQIDRADGTIQTDIPQARVLLSRPALFRGKIDVREVLLLSPDIIIERTKGPAEARGGNVQISPASRLGDLVSLGQRGALNLKVRDLGLNFSDKAANTEWRLESLAADLDAAGATAGAGGLAVNLQTLILNADKNGSASASSAYLSADFSGIDSPESLSGRLSIGGQNVPLGDMVSLFGPGVKSRFTGTVSGEMTANLDAGRVTMANMRLEAHAGVVDLGADPIPIDEALAVARYRPGAGDITIDSLQVRGGLTDISTSGRVWTPTRSIAGPYQFSLSGDAVRLGAIGLFSGPIDIDRFSVAGGLDLRAREIDLQAIDLDLAGAGISGSFRYVASERPDMSPGLFADLKTSGTISYRTIMQHWPVVLAPRSRRWVDERIKNGSARDLVFSMALDPGVRSALGYIPDDALNLSFFVSDVVVDYIPGLPFLTQADGRGDLRGNSLDLFVDRARIETISLSEGSITFPVFNPRGGDIIFRFNAEGDAGEMLSIVNREPLSLLAAAGLSPAQISGPSTVSLSMTRRGHLPGTKAPQPTFLYDGVARFEDLSFREAFADFDLDEATGTIALKSDGFEISALALIGATPVEVGWEQRYFTAQNPSTLSLRGQVDSRTADLLGLGTREYLSGKIGVDLTAVGTFLDFERIALDVDLGDAGLRIPVLEYEKPAGIPVTIQSIANLAIDGAALETSVQGSEIAVEGTARLGPDGRFVSADFPDVKIADIADFSLSASRAENAPLDLKVRGRRVDLGPLLRSFLGTRSLNEDPDKPSPQPDQAADWGAGLRADIALDEINLRGDVTLRETSLDFFRAGTKVEDFAFAGIGPEGRSLSAVYDRKPMADGSGNSRVILAETEDVGTLLTALFGLRSVEGGEGSLVLDLGSDKDRDEEAKWSGFLRAENIRVSGAPLLAKLFAAGSFNGLIDLLADDGIAMSEAQTRFRLTENGLAVDAARIVGPSVGLTAKGLIGLGRDNRVDLEGSVAPLYQLNSMLGGVPLIGDIFVSRKGEGVFAIAYDINGSVAAPTITVNPLSALTPGFLRRAFEDPVDEP